ncbi:MAG: hypothetical protein KA419_12545 [Acidobacteria bacterium]|nr:hypothetical protein [Acidobacteriota bacterium]
MARSATLALLLAFSLASAARAADEGLDSRLERLREEIRERGYGYSVGMNPAMEVPLALLCGTFPEGDPVEKGEPAPSARLALPAHFDWREQAPPLPVRNQGVCGSCWAFAAVGILEYQALIRDGVAIDLSEQLLVDCDRDSSNSGCEGGFLSLALSWLDTNGAVPEAWYPYRYKNFPWGSCLSEGLSRPYRVREFGAAAGTDLIKQAIYDHGPVATSVAVDNAFQAYTGGVFEGPGAPSTNHAVILTGWTDTDTAGNGYWIMRNSWGASWGESGYMRIKYGAAKIGTGTRWAECDAADGPRLVQTRVETDVEGDFVPAPGEECRVRVTLRNQGLPASGVTAELACADPEVTVVSGTVAWPDLPKGAEGPGLTDFVVRFSAQAPMAKVYVFSLTLRASGGYAATGRFWVRLKKPTAIVVDMDPNHNSAPALQAALAACGIDAVTDRAYDLTDVTDLRALFVCFGVMPWETIPQPADGYNIRRAMALGRAVYLESGSIWSDTETDFLARSWFEAPSTQADYGTLASLAGVPGTVFHEINLPYVGDKAITSRLGTGAGAASVLVSGQTGAGCAVTGTGHDYYGTPYVFRSLAAAFEFGGLDEGYGANSRVELLRKYAAHLDILPAATGDLDRNGILDGEDASILRGVLSGSLPLPPYTGADLNGDGRVDPLDLIALERATAR